MLTTSSEVYPAISDVDITSGNVGKVDRPTDLEV
jgi:hypothetical protein